MWSETAVLTCSHKKQKQPAAQIVSQVMLIQRQKNFTGESGAFFLLCSLGATRQFLIQTHSATPLFVREKYPFDQYFAFAHSSWFEDEPFVNNLGASLNGCYPPKVFLPSVFSKRERFSFLPYCTNFFIASLCSLLTNLSNGSIEVLFFALIRSWILRVFHCNYFIKRELKSKMLPKQTNLCLYTFFSVFMIHKGRPKILDGYGIFLSVPWVGKYWQSGLTVSSSQREKNRGTEGQNTPVDQLSQSWFTVASGY